MSPSNESELGSTVKVRHFHERASWQWEPVTIHDHRLLWARNGAISVEADGRRWLSTPMLGLWLPAGLTYAAKGRASSGYVLHVDPTMSPVVWTAVTPIGVGAFLREAIIRLSDPSLTEDERRNTEVVMYDALHPAASPLVELTLPDDARLRRLVDAILENPGDNRTLAEWGREVGASVRTLTRLFTSETGMTFAEWRLQARARAAVAGLSAGATIAAIARAVGYGSPSAFSHAFRELLATQPRPPSR